MITKSSNDEVMMSNTTYDWSKKLVQLWLPAFSAAYFTLASIWGFPAPDKVVGTIAVFTTLLGVLLNVSHNRYKESDDAVDGDIVVTVPDDGERAVASIEPRNQLEPTVLKKGQIIKFRVTEDRERPLTIDDLEEDDEAIG